MHSLDLARVTIERHYEEFVAELPEDLRDAARELPKALELASQAKWADTVILGLPTLLLTQLARPIALKLRASAQRAHLFAMIGARINERLDDGRLAVDARIDALLLAIERQRHRGLAELRLFGADRKSSLTTAERETRSAAAEEREIFAGRSEAELPRYVAICCGKHSLAFPATNAALVAAGAGLDELERVHDVILGVTLGLAARSEVLERSEREQAGRSWVVALSSELGQARAEGELLELALDAFERAARAAKTLGADELSRWARLQAEQARSQRGRASAA